MRSMVQRTTPFLAILGAAGGFAAYALATPPSGQHPSPPVLAMLADNANVNSNRIKLLTNGPVDVATFTVTYDPSGLSGWHRHPGVLIALVQSGSIVRQVGCSSRTYSAGEAFIESDDQPAGQVSNASSTTPAVLSATQLVPHGVPRRVEAQPPSC